MIVNALLVCWNGGWFRLDDPTAIAQVGYRAEGFLSLGAQYDEGEAHRQAQQVLADYRETRVGIETRIDPAPAGLGAAAPYQGWRPTNTISVAGQSHRVRSMRVQLTDDGPEFTPGFGRRAPSESDRLVTAVKKFSPGVMAGDTAIPTPMSPYSAGGSVETAESSSDYLVLTDIDSDRAAVWFTLQVPATVHVIATVWDTTLPGNIRDLGLRVDPGLSVLFPDVSVPPPGQCRLVGPTSLVASQKWNNGVEDMWKVTSSLIYSATYPAGSHIAGAFVFGDAEGLGIPVSVRAVIGPDTGEDTLAWECVT